MDGHKSCLHLLAIVNSVSTSLIVQSVKILPVIQEIWVQSLGQQDPLEKEMTTHSSILFFFSLQYSCLENPMDRRAWQGSQELDTT